MPGQNCRIFHGASVLRALSASGIAVAFYCSRLDAQSPCPNPIVCENALPGNPSSDWDISGAGDSSIQGFATDISVNRGQTISFKVKTDAPSFRLDIYRLGYYAGRGARKVATVNPTVSLPQNQPPCVSQVSTGLLDCGNWNLSATWNVPSNAVSGVYVARTIRADTNGASHIIFVVRDDLGAADLLFQTTDTTWQAYNNYGGASLYGGTGPAPGGRAYKVSYNRPLATRGDNDLGVYSSLFAAEYPMIRWLESNGYNVSYAAGLDTDRRGSAALTAHKVFLSVGHDEYWSSGQRTNVEAARGAGVHLAFFSGNEIFWKTRWENSIDGKNTPFRTLVCYKETHANAKIDPTSTWTGTWRDPRFSPPGDGGRPENAVSGQIFTVNAFRYDPIQISSNEGKLRFWRSAGLDTIASGLFAELPADVLGIEWDEVLDNGFQPAGLIRLSTTTFPVENYLQDYGSTYSPGTATHSLSLYRHSSGALVFGAGTIRWPWGLDDNHDFAGPAPDWRMQQATVNLFADMGSQPGTLQSGLAPSTASTDVLPPSSLILIPTSLTVPAWTSVTIFGSATDVGGGRPAAVELSVDNGANWHSVRGAENWAAAWMPGSPGVVTMQSRAVDDSGRIEVPKPGIPITVTANSARCSLWPAEAAPGVADTPDSGAVELGVRFKSDLNGWITGLRFYKSVANTGVHIGNLWTSSGNRLATVTFTNETTSGWQEAQLATPVPITAGTRYVASYHMDSGHYSGDLYYFQGAGVDRGPLHAPANTVAEPNGAYIYGPSAFPANTVGSENYWVDVVFAASLAPDTTPPLVTAVSPMFGAANVSPTSVSARFNEKIASATVSTSSFFLRDALGSNVPASVSYDPIQNVASLQPSPSLTVGTSYTATVKGGASGVGDLSGNKLPMDISWSFTTGSWTLWPAEAAPGVADTPDSGAVELGVRFKSDLNGWITGLRFYKSVANTGVHIGNLWTSSGNRLATVTFTNETTSGWQEAQLATPVPITAGTRYVASYHMDSGHYSGDLYYFQGAGVDRGPLHAPANTVAEPNGAYIYGPSAFPANTVGSENYWVDVVFTTSNQLAAPVFSPSGGTYAGTQSVTLSIPGSSSAQIYYTANGSTPSISSTRYTGPISLAATATLKAIAVAPGSVNSAVATATYIIQASQAGAPTLTPGTGSYTAAQSVTLSSVTSGAQIYYTTNGSTPSPTSTRYTGPITVAAPTTIKALAVASGLANSSVSTGTYTFQAAQPIFSPAGGSYTAVQSVSLSDSSPGAAIYYTIDGSTPTASSTRYASPISVSSSKTINAIGIVTGWADSGISTATYTIQLPTAPRPPSGLSATAASPTQVNLSWTDLATDETGFKIERKTGSGGAYTQIATAGVNASTYNDVTVLASTIYFYRVRSTNTIGDSSYSNEATVTTPATAGLPAPWVDADIGSPGVAGSGSFTSGSFTVKGSGSDIWNATDAFNFVYQPLNGNAEIVARVNSVQNTDPWAKAGLMIRENLTSGSRNVFVGITPGNGLTFQRRLTVNGASTYTAGASVSAPYWLRFVRAGDTFTGYASIDGLTWLQVGADTIPMSGTVQIGLAVTAHNNAALNQSIFSNVFLTVEPAAPSGLTAVASGSQINLSWSDNSSNESGFRIERKTGAAGAYGEIATVAAGVTSYTNSGLAAGTTYFYRLRSTNSGGDSAYSNEGSATTAGGVTAPLAPGSLTALPVSGTQINLAWTDVANETGFKIERKTGAGGTYAQIATTSAGVVTYSNTGLAAGTSYYFRVRSTNGGGDSAYSPEANATTSIAAFRAAASAGAASGVLSLKINKPSGTLAGDVLVASIAVRPSTATINASGWTLIRRLDNTTGNSNSLAVYYKVAGASEPASYTWSFNSSAGSAGGIQAFSGIDTASPVDVEAGVNTASGLAIGAPSVNTRFANDMLVTSHSFASAASFTPPAGMAEGFDVASNSAGSGGDAIEGCYQRQAATGATGARGATASNDADTGNSHTLALKAR